MLKKYLVWDLPVRLFHWLLVVSLLFQWASAEWFEDMMEWHFINGYFILGLVLFRLIWGFIGTRYSRFSSFLGSPFAVIRYAKLLISRSSPEYTGHNPLGGLIVPVVLLIVGLQAVSGLFSSDDILYSGPYYSAVEKVYQDYANWLHHNLFNAILVVAIIHILAIAWYQWVLKRNLTKPMIHGRKYLNRNPGITSSKMIVALILAVLVAIFIYWLVVMNAPTEVDAYYY